MMKKFNKLFTESTKVQIAGEYGYRNIASIHPSRQWIKVEGIEGSHQRGHIVAFTNAAAPEMYPALEDLYVTDQYDSVYEKGEFENHHIGKLNGRTLKQFISEYGEQI